MRSEQYKALDTALYTNMHFMQNVAYPSPSSCGEQVIHVNLCLTSALSKQRRLGNLG